MTARPPSRITSKAIAQTVLPSHELTHSYYTILTINDGRTVKYNVFERTSSKRRITNIANRFDQIKGEVNAHQTAQGLREDMREALSKFGEINEQLWSLLEAAELSADRTTTSHTVSEDISDSDQYVTKAEDILFEISRYLDNHPAEVNPAVYIARFHFVP